ncbi:YdeI/OmpD-associated family protein [Micromonospora purpureochromogenes]|uniref:YdeI/OmpD-associated family protein n=1 Tax=Micromonospora purpureochromogenes TaxID=47872 RepID=UPI003403FC6B
MASAELEELIVADADALRVWLSANHAASPGVWLALTKKGGRVTTLTWQQAVDEALCFALIHRVNAAKRAQTRQRKIGEFVAMLARHETIHPQKAKPPDAP